MVSDCLSDVRNHIEQAAMRAGRDSAEIKLIAVSKTKPVSMIEECMAHGQLTFGENKVQELMEKRELHPELEWHLIGHLQKNKVKYVVGNVALIHSVDSVELAQKIQIEAEKHNCDVDILLEVNVAKEETKSGFFAEDVLDACLKIAPFSRVHIKGLMTVAPNVADPEENRVIFRNLKQILVDIQGKKVDNVDMRELSMGMTNDYEIAIEEGATLVRIGSAIFGKRNYSI